MFTSRTTPFLRTLPRLSNTTPRLTNAIPRTSLRRMATTAPRRPLPTHTTLHHNPAAARAELAAQKRRQVLLIVGMTMSMSTLWLLATSIELKTESSSSTPSIKPGTPVILHTDAEKAAGVELVPSGTTSVPPFPKTLQLAGLEYALIGLGIRTVSFLGIEVYVVGFYVAADDLALLQERLVKRLGEGVTAATSEERDVLKGALLDVNEGEAFWEGVLVGGVRSCLRIVPTRNTDYQHLRDGWVRSIQARSSKSPLYDDDAFSNSLTAFKQAFGQKKAVPKQKTLLLVRDVKGGLECLYDPSGRNDGKVGGKGEKGQVVVLGRVEDIRLSTVLWLCYLAGAKVASEPARKSVVEGLMALAERPIGTVGSAMP